MLFFFTGRVSKSSSIAAANVAIDSPSLFLVVVSIQAYGEVQFIHSQFKYMVKYNSFILSKMMTTLVIEVEEATHKY